MREDSIVTVLPQRAADFQGELTVRVCDWALSSSSVPNGLLEGAAIVSVSRIEDFAKMSPKWGT